MGRSAHHSRICALLFKRRICNRRSVSAEAINICVACSSTDAVILESLDKEIVEQNCEVVFQLH